MQKVVCLWHTIILNFTCHDYGHITQENDFRLRVSRKGSNSKKRGSRMTCPGMRLDYLSSHKLANHRHQVSKKFRFEHLMYWVQKVCVAQVKMTRPNL